MRPRYVAFTVLAAMCAALFALPAHADRDTAKFHHSRAEKLLAKKQYAESEKLFRKALEEDEGFLPARFGLAKALMETEQKALAVAELRRLCSDARAAKDMPATWSTIVRKARKLLAKFDELGTAYQRLLDKHVNALLAFANKWRAKDPDVALKAVEQALTLLPEHEKALDALAEMGKERLPPAQPLFNGENLKGWFQMSAPTWTVKDGILTGRPGENAFAGRTLKRFEGEFDVIFEARMGEKTGRVAHFVVSVMESHSEKTSFGWLKDAVSVMEYAGSKEHEELFDILPDKADPPFNVKEWTVYELRLRPDKIHCLINGKEVYVFDRRAQRASGYVGLVVQACVLEIKRVEIRQR